MDPSISRHMNVVKMKGSVMYGNPNTCQGYGPVLRASVVSALKIQETVTYSISEFHSRGEKRGKEGGIQAEDCGAHGRHVEHAYDCNRREGSVERPEALHEIKWGAVV
jgi:hypothetical protein